MNTFKHAFNNHTYGTRYGFKHVSDLIIDDRVVSSHTCKYYNRTWEAYQYRTSMRCCCYDYLHKLESECIDLYKQTFNYKRMTAARKADFIQFMRTMNYEHYNDIMEVLERL